MCRLHVELIHCPFTKAIVIAYGASYKCTRMQLAARKLIITTSKPCNMCRSDHYS